MLRSLLSSRPPLAAAACLGLCLLAACADPEAAPETGAVDSATASGYASGQAAGAEAPPTGGDPAPPSVLDVNRTEQFYEVTGRTARALLHDMTRKGPRIGSQRHFGRTSWTAGWNLTYAEPAAGASAEQPCRIRHVDVQMDVDVTLPRWDAPEDAEASLERDWHRFTEALAFHEREHKESIISAGRRVVRALEALEASSCSALKERANAEARSIIDAARDYNRRYDERTQHGRTQGARWPL